MSLNLILADAAPKTTAIGPGAPQAAGPAAGPVRAVVNRPFREPRPHAPTAEEREAFEAFIDKLNDPIWRQGS